jgi:hypothetical protein
MAMDLETAKTEIKTYLEQSNLGVFHGYSGMGDSVSVYWDTERHPDFREFLKAAEKAGVKLVVFYSRQFSLDQIDEIIEELQEADFTREEKRNYEHRLRDIQKYEGFTCEVELSFALDGRVYLFQMQTDWYRAWEDILSEIDSAVDEDIQEDEGPIPGYFSNN